jgi:hypothetical protein
MVSEIIISFTAKVEDEEEKKLPINIYERPMNAIYL